MRDTSAAVVIRNGARAQRRFTRPTDPNAPTARTTAAGTSAVSYPCGKDFVVPEKAPSPAQEFLARYTAAATREEKIAMVRANLALAREALNFAS